MGCDVLHKGSSVGVGANECRLGNIVCPGEREDAAKLARGESSPLVRLPADHMLEAQAFGCRVRRLSDGNGLEALACCRNVAEISALGPIDVEVGGVAACLQECAWRSQGGESVLFLLTGPMTLASSLMGAPAFLKAVRRDPVGTFEALRHLERESSRLAQAAQQAGTALVGLSDPLCGREYFGPKMLREFGQSVLLDCVRDLAAALRGRSALALCPRACAALQRIEGVRFERVSVPTGQTRWQAMLSLAGQADAWGGVCLEAAPLDELGGELLALHLT